MTAVRQYQPSAAVITHIEDFLPKEVQEEKLIPCDLSYHPADEAQEAWEKRKRVDELVSVDEINTMVRHLLNEDKVRDALIFIVSCNTGLRISDILWFRWKDLTPGDHRIMMQKTKKYKEYYLNDAVVECARLYKRVSRWSCEPDDYVFISEGKNSGHVPIPDRKAERAVVRQITTKIQPLRVETVCRTMTQAGKESGLATPVRRISTHTGRKTHANALNGGVIGFTVGKEMNDRAAGVILAQVALGHAKAETTKDHYLASEYKLHRECCKRMNFGLDEVRAYRKRKGID